MIVFFGTAEQMAKYAEAKSLDSTQIRLADDLKVSEIPKFAGLTTVVLHVLWEHTPHSIYLLDQIERANADHGWNPMTTDATAPVDRLAADIRRIDGDNTKGAAEIAQALVESGWTHASFLESASVEPDSLALYKAGQEVEVLLMGTWVHGHISERDSAGYLHVQTERGPTTVASTHYIKPLDPKK